MPMKRSHIWLGHFTSKKALNEYFEESYFDDESDEPINQFARDQGESFYDHDWVERSFRAKVPIRLLIHGHSYFEDYVDSVVRIAEEMQLLNVN